MSRSHIQTGMRSCTELDGFVRLPSAKWLAGATAAFLLAVAPSPAVAQAADDWAAEVRYGDLNLSTPTGRAELDKRVAQAIRKNCASAQRPTVEERNLRTRCVNAALARSTRQVAAVIERSAGSRQVAERRGELSGSSTGKPE